MIRERPPCRPTGAVGPAAMSAVLLAASACCALAAPRRPTAEELVRRCLAAQDTVALRGTVVVVSPSAGGVSTSTRRIVRGPTGATLTTILTPRSQRGALTLDDGTWTTTYEPSHRLAKIKRSPPRCAASVARRTRRVLANYTATVEDEVPLAGRVCYRLRLTPRAGDGCIVTLWVDRQKGVELGREECDRRGNTHALMLFTEVEFPGRLSSKELAFRPPKGTRCLNVSRGAYSRSLATLSSIARFPVVAPLTVPAGYEFECGHVVRINGADTAVLRYSNGLVNLTICQTESAVPAPVGAMRLARGESVVAVSTGRRHVVIFGHHPTDALYAVAGALDPRLCSSFESRIAAQFGVGADMVRSLRDRGLTAEGVVVALAARRRTRLTVAQLVNLYEQGWGWRDIAHRYGIRHRDVAAQITAFQASWSPRR